MSRKRGCLKEIVKIVIVSLVIIGLIAAYIPLLFA